MKWKLHPYPGKRGEGNTGFTALEMAHSLLPDGCLSAGLSVGGKASSVSWAVCDISQELLSALGERYNVPADRRFINKRYLQKRETEDYISGPFS